MIGHQESVIMEFRYFIGTEMCLLKETKISLHMLQVGEYRGMFLWGIQPLNIKLNQTNGFCFASGSHGG